MVPETSSDTQDPSELNVYTAVAGLGDFAFDMWAIDWSYGYGAWEKNYEHRTPLVDKTRR